MRCQHFYWICSDQTENTTDEQVLWDACHGTVFAQPDMERHEHRHVPPCAGMGKDSALYFFHVQEKVYPFVSGLQVLHPVRGHPHACCVAWDGSNVKVWGAVVWMGQKHLAPIRRVLHKLRPIYTAFHARRLCDSKQPCLHPQHWVLWVERDVKRFTASVLLGFEMEHLSCLIARVGWVCVPT